MTSTFVGCAVSDPPSLLWLSKSQRSRNNKNLSPSSVKTIHRSRSQSLSRSGSESSALSATPRRPTRQASPRSPIHTTSQADATLRLSPRQQRAKERKVSLEAAYETDAANEGGGEETEAEPPTTAGDIRRAAKRADTDAARRRKTALLEFPEQASPGLARYKKLRGRSTSMPGQGSQDRASAMRDALRASAAKGRRSGDSSDPFASGASEGTPLARRLRRSNSTMFLASSPIRTRARSRNQSGPVRRRPVTRCSTSAVEIFGDSARTPRPKRRGGSGKHVAFRNQDRESEVGHEGESSDGWDGMPVDDAPRDGQIKEADRLGARARSTPQRRAKTRAQETMQVDSSTEDELNLIRDSAVDMQDVNGPAEKSDEESSIDEDTPVKAWASRTARDAKANGRTSGSGSRKLTRRSAGSPQDSTPNSWMSTSSSGNDKSADEDYEGSDAENSASQSPSKARRLRNGKVRLSPPVEAGEPEPERDTEEEEEAEEEEAKRSDASGLPNGDVEMADGKC